jgi:chitodextrinase
MAWEHEKPPAPAGVTTTPLSATAIAIEWGGLPGGMAAGGYEVRGGESPTLTGATTAQITGLSPRTRYCFTVFALTAARKRGYPSDAVCIATLPDTTPPSVPSGLSAEVMGAQVAIRWQPATDDVAVAGYDVLRGGQLVGKVVGPRAVESGLSPGEHCYAVRAFDSAGNQSGQSETVCARAPDLTPPSPPSGVTVSASKETEVFITWTPSTDDVGVTGYEVLRGEARVAVTERTEAAEFGLSAGTQYCYRVVARDAAGNRSLPSGATCATPPDRTPPAHPEPMIVTVDGDQVGLRWHPTTDNIGVTGYEIWRDKERVTRVGTAETSWTDAGPKPSSQSCYAIRALDAAGNISSFSIHACVRTPDRTPPSEPRGLAAAPASPTEIALGWSPSTDNVGVVGYEVLRDGKVVADVTRLRAMAQGLAPGVEHCHAVRAYDEAGNRSKASEPACSRTADPSLPRAPTNLDVERVSSEELRLRWDQSPESGAVYVEIGRAHV